MGRAILAIIALCAPLSAQTPAAFPELRWVSEFRRVGPDGQVIGPDNEGRPREILSPAVARNGYTTFHLVVYAPLGKPYNLYFGANPETVVRYHVFREIFQKESDRWLPERLDEVKLPVQRVIPDKLTPIPGHIVDVYLVDIFVPPTAAVRRVRVEAQLNVAKDWIVSPLELRLQTASIPLLSSAFGQLARLEATSSDTSYDVLRQFLCGKPAPYRDAEPSVRAFLRRNAIQDAALAALLEPKPAAAGQLRATLAGSFGAADAASLCANPPKPPGKYNPELYFKIRDYLYRLALE
jgi:hypothetical protein